jgi:hypothetical protein
VVVPYQAPKLADRLEKRMINYPHGQLIFHHAIWLKIIAGEMWEDGPILKSRSFSRLSQQAGSLLDFEPQTLFSDYWEAVTLWNKPRVHHPGSIVHTSVQTAVKKMRELMDHIFLNETVVDWLTQKTDYPEFNFKLGHDCVERDVVLYLSYFSQGIGPLVFYLLYPDNKFVSCLANALKLGFFPRTVVVYRSPHEAKFTYCTDIPLPFGNRMIVTNKESELIKYQGGDLISPQSHHVDTKNPWSFMKITVKSAWLAAFSVFARCKPARMHFPVVPAHIEFKSINLDNFFQTVEIALIEPLMSRRIWFTFVKGIPNPSLWQNFTELLSLVIDDLRVEMMLRYSLATNGKPWWSPPELSAEGAKWFKIVAYGIPAMEARLRYEHLEFNTPCRGSVGRVPAYPGYSPPMLPDGRFITPPVHS